jgi:alcohol dehydrogenase class IV
MDLFGKVNKVLIITLPSIRSQGLLDEIVNLLSQQGIHTTAITGVMREPTADNIQQLAAEISGEDFDAYIGIGGGSVLDATKLLAVLKTNSLDIEDMLGTDRIPNAGIPTVLIPTTSGTGSEVTPNAIVTLPKKELKIGAVSRHLLPGLTIVDPLLTLELPKPMTAATGMDAFTHALESYISNKANRVSDMFALQAIRNIANGIVEAYHHGQSIAAREEMIMGSMYAGMALTAAGTAAVHAMAYPLGGKFNIPHGVANSMLLPHVTEFNIDRITDRLADIAEAMGLGGSRAFGSVSAAESVIGKIMEWTKELGIPQDLTAFGVTEKDIPELAAAASNVRRLMDNNPKEMEIEDIERVYRKLLPSKQ